MQRSTVVVTFLAAAGLACLVVTGTVRRADADESWKPVTIVYEGDVGGKIEPCG